MTLDTHALGDELKNLGFTFYSGVPCSFLNNLINYSMNECDYVMASNEGDAVAICAGAQLAGKKSVALMQNSGLTNATSPLTSLNYSFRLPLLGFVSLRGEPEIGDEPQHELMGIITEKLLDLMEISWEYLSLDLKEAKAQLGRADEAIRNNRTFFFVVKKGTLSKVELEDQKLRQIENKILIGRSKEEELPLRMNVLESLLDGKDDDTVLLATTGKTGRELYELGDLPNNFYMVGSMGCISSLGLGLAMNSHKRVIAIDGDGSLIMRLGNVAANAYYGPNNFLHLLIDNNVHDSTGGQFTLAGNMNFVQIAACAGYKKSIYIHSLEEFGSAFADWKANPALTFMHIRVRTGTKENLGRPKIKPNEVKNRIMEFING